MFDPNNYPLCEAFIKELNKKFISGGWIVLNSPKMACALVSDEALPNCLQKYQWDLNWDEARPYVIECVDDHRPQFPKDKSGLFPFIYQRESKGNHRQTKASGLAHIE